MYAFVMKDLLTGMRRSEILVLEQEDVNLNKGILNIRKTFLPVIGGTILVEKTKNESSKIKIKISTNLINILKKLKKNKQN